MIRPKAGSTIPAKIKILFDRGIESRQLRLYFTADTHDRFGQVCRFGKGIGKRKIIFSNVDTISSGLIVQKENSAA